MTFKEFRDKKCKCGACKHKDAITEIIIPNSMGGNWIVSICEMCLYELNNLSTNDGDEKITIIDKYNDEDIFKLKKGRFYNWRLRWNI